MTFIGCFMRMMWNFICLWLFVASIRPFKMSKVWKTWYQNACNWDSFGGYFIIHDRLIWELKSFLFHGIEMKLVHKSLYVFRVLKWNYPFHNKIKPKLAILKYLNYGSSEIPYLYYDLWNNKADIVMLSFNNEWVLLVHWWQRQAAVEGLLRGDERAPDIPPAKPCAQPSEAARHFEVELRQPWYGGSYKAKYVPWCLVGTNDLSTYCWAYRFS